MVGGRIDKRVPYGIKQHILPKGKSCFDKQLLSLFFCLYREIVQGWIKYLIINRSMFTFFFFIRKGNHLCEGFIIDCFNLNYKIKLPWKMKCETYKIIFDFSIKKKILKTIAVGGHYYFNKTMLLVIFKFGIIFQSVANISVIGLSSSSFFFYWQIFKMKALTTAIFKSQGWINVSTFHFIRCSIF
jgi:hypothetical protein